MTATTYTVLIVDDHALVREGIAAILSAHPQFEVTGSVETVEGALEACARRAPDIVILDLRLRGDDGLRALGAIRSRHPATRVLVLSSHEGDETIQRALDAGAAGYLLKRGPSRELVDALERVMRGERVASPRVVEVLAARASGAALSGREIAVLRRIAHGESNREIATALGIGANTVKTHVNNLLAKLGASDRTEAVTIALQRGIITLED